jgi:diguanylate cyclase (GGDEF)-like protein
MNGPPPPDYARPLLQVPKGADQEDSAFKPSRGWRLSAFGDASKPSRTTLLQTLRRAHVRVATISMAAVVLALSLSAFASLRSYAGHNLQLIARTIAYTVEAGVVFRDKAAVREQVFAIARREGLTSAELTDASGKVLASYVREPAAEAQGTEHAADTRPGMLERSFAAVSDGLAQILMPQATVAPILYQGRQIGAVSLRGGGAAFVQFALTALCGIVLCTVLVALGIRQSSRRTQRDILEPVRALTAVTHGVRFHQSSPHRAPPSRIAEFHELGEDFNALLVEIETHQARLDQENKSLSHMANHDSLTGLPNRAFFRRRLARVLQDAQAQGTGLAVLYLDNDHFKQINDRYGHATGDLLLVEVAQRIRAQLRESDLVARLGGDEFAILLAPVHHVDDALRIAHKITASMAAPLSVRRRDRIVPSVSIGIAVYPDHGQTPEQLLRAADAAMYRVKKNQRGGSHLSEAAPDASDYRDPQ